MGQARYDIRRAHDGWRILHDGQTLGGYATKEAAFEAAVGPASNAIKQGHGVTISVEASAEGEPALGLR
jgi:hypothetical protein